MTSLRNSLLHLFLLDRSNARAEASFKLAKIQSLASSIPLLRALQTAMPLWHGRAIKLAIMIFMDAFFPRMGRHSAMSLRLIKSQSLPRVCPLLRALQTAMPLWHGRTLKLEIRISTDASFPQMGRRSA